MNLTVLSPTFSVPGLISTFKCLIAFEIVPLFPLTVMTLDFTLKVTKGIKNYYLPSLGTSTLSVLTKYFILI
jgi:hypothetical protein